MMLSRLLAATILVIALAPPTMAQDAAYTPGDETNMQQCFETVNDINSDTEGTDTVSLSDCIGSASNACQEEPGGSSTPGIVACNQREQSWWDAQLNAYYDQLQQTLEADVFTSLKTAQRAWIAYRDAKCSFIYELWRDGTIRSVMHSSCMLHETANRAMELGDALNPEG